MPLLIALGVGIFAGSYATVELTGGANKITKGFLLGGAAYLIYKKVN